VKVRVNDDGETYAPSQTVELEVRTTDETHRPLSAILGVKVVEADVAPLASVYETSLPAFVYLTAEMNRPQEIENAHS
jgi:hypothetical protein